MSQHVGDRVHSLNGEGVVLIAAPGDDMPEDAVNHCVVMWSANEAVTERDITTTCNYNPVTREMNDESIITGRRLEGTFTVIHNSVVGADILLLVPPGTYPQVRLYITQGNVAVAGSLGPPVVTAVPASRVCYFDLPMALIGQRSIPGGDPKEERRIEYSFKSNGVYNYVNEPAA